MVNVRCLTAGAVTKYLILYDGYILIAKKVKCCIFASDLAKERGHWLSPRLLNMVEIVEKVNALLVPILDGTDIFVVSVKVKPVNNIKVYLDADSGLSIDKAVAVNRKLYPGLEESGMFPAGDFSLEVSSPGVDEPLIHARQYVKNKGRKVMITDMEGVEKTGMLMEVAEDHVTLEIKGKKPKDATVVAEIPFSNIKSTVVQIIF
jgi:ribosome maturation factor RimP